MSDNSTITTPAQRTPPALSFQTFTNIVDSFKDTQIPSPIDKSVFSDKVPGGTKTYMLAALKYLGFISENNIPESLFQQMVQAEKEEKKTLWLKVLNDRYAFLLGDEAIDITKTTTSVVYEKFKAQGITGDTVRKAITFFLHAAKEAGLKVSSHVKAPRPPRGQAKPKKLAEKSGAVESDGNGVGQTKNHNDGNNPPAKLHYQMLIDILNKNMRPEEQDAVWTIIRYLKNNEPDEE